MKRITNFSAMLLIAALVCLPSSPAFAANFDSIPVRAIKSVNHVLKGIRHKFSKKKPMDESATEVLIEVEPNKNYSVTLKKVQRLALVLDANDGRIWHIEARADKIVDERPEGKANVTYTTIFFTPKEVDGEGDIILKTKILENYPEDWTNADTCVIHITVHNAP